MPSVVSTGFSSNVVCALTGITFRQLDYWTRTGMVVPSVVDAHGSGRHRRWSESDVRKIAVLGAFSRVAPGLRRVLAERLRDLDVVPRFVVVVGDWGVRFCDSPDDVAKIRRTEDWRHVLSVLATDGLVPFDA